MAAKSEGFDMVLPLLVRRLIIETSVGLVSVDMPGGTGVAASGFDGVIVTIEASPFVPEGTSVWELSVGGGQAKAEDDYSKRVISPNSTATAEITYVEVILEPWTKARSWSNSHLDDGRWRDVLGYNLDRVHAWLDIAPATTVWLAGRLGRNMPGVQVLSEWWRETWIPSTRIPLGEQIVLAGREKAAEEFLSCVASGQSIITVRGDLRAEEYFAFVSAAVMASNEVDASMIGSRTLIVSDASSLAQLISQSQPLVILLEDAAAARNLPQHHPHQIVIVAPPGASADVDVPRIHANAVEAQLLTFGLPRDEAARLATLGRRSFLAMRRHLANTPSLLTPPWAESPDTARRRLLMLGSWDDSSAEDRRLVSQFVGTPYERVQDLANQLSSGSDIPFMSRTGDIWYIPAIEDAWELLAPSITSDDPVAFRDIYLEVLTERDPVWDLEPSVRWRAAVDGIARHFSRSLRDGLVKSIALFSVNDTSVPGTSGLSGSQWVRRLVMELLGKANADATYRLWASLTDVLPLLAEASPEAFLEGMRVGLTGTSPQHAMMFTDSVSDDFMGNSSSLHSHFLWALEILAWSPIYFDDAVDVLAQLAVIDPGGNLGSRPLRSLVGILSSWSPNTCASAERRVRAMERISLRQPSIADVLFHNLLPDGNGFQDIHPGPQFHEWKTVSQVLPEDQRRVTDAAFRLLMDSDETFESYLSMIDRVGAMSPGQRSALASRIEDLCSGLDDDEQRRHIFEKLRDLIARHREYSNAQWALPERELIDLERACNAAQPRDPIRRLAWLFTSSLVCLGDVPKRDNFAAYEAELESRRADAIREILTNGGLDEIDSLASLTSEPYLVGIALADASTTFDTELLEWLESDDAIRRGTAAGYARKRIQIGGTDTLTELLAVTSSPLAQARLLCNTPDIEIAWSKLSTLNENVAENYWREFVPFGLGPGFPFAVETAWKLMDAGRPGAALQLILQYGLKQDTIEVAEVTTSGLELLLQMGEQNELRSLDSYSLESLFELIAKRREQLGRQRVVNLEWQYFPMLGAFSDAPTLHDALVEDPAFFVEVTCLLYKPASAEGTDEDADDSAVEQRRIMATRAFEVLHSFHRCPGVGVDGILELEELRTWVTIARHGFAEADRADIGDLSIGELLAYAPDDGGGIAIPRAIREILEELRSGRIEEGLQIAIRNRRGMTSRNPLDGGQQEWSLAQQFRLQAELVDEWPRTRKVLIELAEAYEIEARRNDESAERRHRGLGW
jgi:hypothetical protein